MVLKKKKTAWTDWGTLAVFVMLSSFPGLPTKSFLKFILHSNENDKVMKFQFRFAGNAKSSPAFGQRTSVDQLAQLSAAPMNGFFSWRGLFQQRELEIHSFSAGMQRSKRRFSFCFQKTLPVYWEIAHAWRKTQMNVLVWSAILHVVELRVLVYSRVHLKFAKYGNVSAFSRIFRDFFFFFVWSSVFQLFFVTCVVPALCQIMYSLSVCSDGTDLQLVHYPWPRVFV